MSLMGIDVGTTGCKAIVFREDGVALGAGYREYPLHHPRPGWAEIDPRQVWDAVRESVRAALAGAGSTDPVRAVSVSSQGEAVAPIDRDGTVLANSIVSFDARTAPQRDRWARDFDVERLFQMTGMPLHTMYTLLKIEWIRENDPGLYRRVWKFLCYGDFTLHRLGAPPAIDTSMAARTMAFDLHTMRWSPELLAFAGLEEDKLAAVHPSGEVVGAVSESASRDLGLPAGIPLVAGAHDQPAGALGAGITRSGIAMDATGTVECVCPAFAEPVLSPAMFAGNYCCYPHAVPGLFVTIAFNFTGGSLLRWFRDQFGHLETEEATVAGLDVYEILLGKAASRPSPVLVLPHFTVTGTPWFDSDARGAILGLTLGTTRNDVLQGILDGVTLEMRLNLERLAAAGIEIRELRAIGGGAKSRIWTQLKANVFQRPVCSLSVSEAACFGAALLAGHGAGIYPSLREAADHLVKVKEQFDPDPEAAKQYDEVYRLYERITPTLADLSHSIAARQAGRHGNR